MNLMTHDDAEFLMSQQLDGTLDVADARRLHAAIEADALLAALWREHQTLDAALRASRMPAASSNESLVASVAAAIDDEPERTIKLASWNRWKTPFAAAAMLAIGLTVGILSMRGGGTREAGSPVAQQAPAPTAIDAAHAPGAAVALVESRGPAADPIQRAPGGYATVSVGVPPNLTPSIVASLYVAERVSRDRVVIEAKGRREPDIFE